MRSRLISAGLAEGLQSPKGRQKFASILRIYPAFDAPAAPAPVKRGPRAARNVSAKGTRVARAAQPTVEQIESLISRIRAEESAMAKEMSAHLDDEIRSLQISFANLGQAEVESAHNKLGAALDQKRESSKLVRQAAFQRIMQDAEFAPGKYIRLISG